MNIISKLKDFKGKEKKYHERINYDIRISPVRVIDENGNALGVIATQEALKIAQSRGLDLVEISPNSKPPVCKIADFGKYNYERQKKEKQAKKNQSVVHIKEIRFNPNIDTHDVEFKTKHLRQFLIEGHKIKITVMFKGRMITHPEIGRKTMEDILNKLEDIGKVDSPPKMEGKQLIAYVSPDKNKITAAAKAEKPPKPKGDVKTETAADEDVKAETDNKDEVKDSAKPDTEAAPTEEAKDDNQ